MSPDCYEALFLVTNGLLFCYFKLIWNTKRQYHMLKQLFP